MNNDTENQSFSITNLLNSGSPLSRKEAIAKIGSEKATEYNENLLELLGSNEEVFANKVEILETFSKIRSPEIIEGLSRFLETETPDPALEPLLYYSLETLIPLDPSIIEKKLSSPSDQTLSFYITEAGRMRRKEALPHLLKLISVYKENIELLIPLLECFGYIGSEEACSTIKEFITHPDKLVACTAIESLSFSCSENLTKDLIDLLGSDEFINMTVISSLKNIGGEEAIRAISEFLSSDNPTLRNIAVDSLVTVGEECIQYLTPNLSSEDPDIKINTLNFFYLLGSRLSLPHVLPLCTDPDTNIRITAFGVLEKIGIPENAPAILDGISDTETPVRQAALNALESHPDKQVFSFLCTKAKEDGPFRDFLIDSIVNLGAANIFLGIRHIEVIRNGVYKRFMQLRVAKLYDEFTSNLEKVASKEIVKEFTSSVSVDKMFVNKFHILLVDDSRFVRKMISSQLQIMGFLITTAEDGLSAEKILEQTDDIDLIITDINMPVIDGLELIRRIKQNPDIDDVPIIVIS
ncbi:MAG: HEAT repeat domain-containing protein, partial [Nitrospinota bacterium]